MKLRPGDCLATDPTGAEEYMDDATLAWLWGWFGISGSAFIVSMILYFATWHLLWGCLAVVFVVLALPPLAGILLR